MRASAKHLHFLSALVFIAGCSSGSAAHFANVEDLAAALQHEHLGCAGLSQPDVNASGPGLPASSGSCTVGGEGVQLFVFATAEDADRWFESGNMESETTARGADWVIVTVTQQVADEIAAALGGSS